MMHVFELEGHPRATRAYAWSSPIEGGTKRRFYAVLHVPPVSSPADAVRAAIVVTIGKSGARGIRTPNPWISSPVLYPLSYRRIVTRPADRVTGASRCAHGTASAAKASN
jgi:hypothetical protein